MAQNIPAQSSLTFQNITLGYPGRVTLAGFSGRIAPGSKIAITGENGAGKSTLLKTIAGLLDPLDGAIITPPQQGCAYLAQQCEIDKYFPVTVRSLVTMGLWSNCGLWRSHRPYQDKLNAALEATGLQNLAKRPLQTLSGGQLQRALFARIIVQDAQLILLDEPFNAVDTQTQTQLLKLIQNWQDEGRTILMALHDPNLIEKYFSHSLHICNGQAYISTIRKKIRPVSNTRPIHSYERAAASALDLYQNA